MGAGEASEGREGRGWSGHGSAPTGYPVCSGGADLDHAADVGDTAVESELWLLRHSTEYAFDRVFWVPYDEWRGEQGSGQGETQGEEEERRAPEEAREGEVEARE